jgi:hypothetical protein
MGKGAAKSDTLRTRNGRAWGNLSSESCVEDYSNLLSDASSSGGTTDNAPSSTTKPRSGEVAADANKRFLAEIVALRALSKASDIIAKSIAEAGEGGILIVNKLDFAADEIFYLDIRHKLDTLLKLSEEAEKECQEFE